MKTAWEKEVAAAAEDYAAQAAARRRISPHDPAADTLEYVARDLKERARQLTEPKAMRSVAEYAAELGVNPQTVRRWIRQSLIPAKMVSGKFMIPAGAHPSRPGALRVA